MQMCAGREGNPVKITFGCATRMNLNKLNSHSASARRVEVKNRIARLIHKYGHEENLFLGQNFEYEDRSVGGRAEAKDINGTTIFRFFSFSVTVT
jgi:hypothetical protein